VALIVSASVDAPQAARQAVDRLPQLAREESETLKLLISELVTNSILHAGLRPLDTIWVAISTDPVLRVEVADHGPGFERDDVWRARRRGHGWGLALVDQMTSRWGVERGSPTRVWFELDRDLGRRDLTPPVPSRCGG
jgi:anti-sigma regulatory factor (Ser/Thr protein kinase)